MKLSTIALWCSALTKIASAQEISRSMMDMIEMSTALGTAAFLIDAASVDEQRRYHQY